MQTALQFNRRPVQISGKKNEGYARSYGEQCTSDDENRQRAVKTHHLQLYEDSILSSHAPSNPFNRFHPRQKTYWTGLPACPEGASTAAVEYRTTLSEVMK